MKTSLQEMKVIVPSHALLPIGSIFNYFARVSISWLCNNPMYYLAMCIAVKLTVFSIILGDISLHDSGSGTFMPHNDLILG